jgi:hypothetical protein
MMMATAAVFAEFGLFVANGLSWRLSYWFSHRIPQYYELLIPDYAAENLSAQVAGKIVTSGSSENDKETTTKALRCCALTEYFI